MDEHDHELARLAISLPVEEVTPAMIEAYDRSLFETPDAA
jgi:hypothetical protein